MSGALPWYIARSAGLIAWALLSASVIWGLTMSSRTRPFGHRPRPAWMLDLHRWLGGLASVFVAVHLAAILADRYVNFSVLSVLVPFQATWRTGAVAWGVVAMWFLVAVESTSLLRRHLPRQAWRMVHGASFPLFIMATVHAFTAGTDASTLAFEAVAIPVILAVAVLTAKRLAEVTRPGPPPRGSAPSGSATSGSAATGPTDLVQV